MTKPPQPEPTQPSQPPPLLLTHDPTLDSPWNWLEIKIMRDTSDGYICFHIIVGDRKCHHLSWDETLGQLASLLLPGKRKPVYRMLTDEEYWTQHLRCPQCDRHSTDQTKCCAWCKER